MQLTVVLLSSIRATQTTLRHTHKPPTQTSHVVELLQEQKQDQTSMLVQLSSASWFPNLLQSSEESGRLSQSWISEFTSSIQSFCWQLWFFSCSHVLWSPTGLSHGPCWWLFHPGVSALLLWWLWSLSQFKLRITTIWILCISALKNQTTSYFLQLKAPVSMSEVFRPPSAAGPLRSETQLLFNAPQFRLRTKGTMLLLF